MAIAVKPDADVDELLRNAPHNRDVDFNQVLNDVIRAALAPKNERFVQKTYSLGSDHLGLTHALFEGQELERRKREGL